MSHDQDETKPDVSIAAVADAIHETAPIKSPAIEAFLAERMRQVTELGYDETMDYQREVDLVMAGNCYIGYATGILVGVESDSPPYDWPLDPAAWKPNVDNPWRDIEKGVALIAAGYDEMMREETERT